MTTTKDIRERLCTHAFLDNIHIKNGPSVRLVATCAECGKQLSVDVWAALHREDLS